MHFWARFRWAIKRAQCAITGHHINDPQTMLRYQRSEPVPCARCGKLLSQERE